MDPLLKKIIILGAIVGAITGIASFVLSAATNIVRVKDAIDAIPALQKTNEDFERRLSEQERNSKMILGWLQAFGERWDVKQPKPWEGRRRRE